MSTEADHTMPNITLDERPHRFKTHAAQLEIRLLKSALVADISVTFTPLQAALSAVMRAACIEVFCLTIGAICAMTAATCLSLAVMCSLLIQ